MQRVTLKNIHLCFDGDFNEDVADEISDDPTGYLSGRVFGKMPVFGLLVRHASDIVLDGVRLRTEKPDPRPAFRFEEVTNLRMNDCPGSEAETVSAFSIDEA